MWTFICNFLKKKTDLNLKNIDPTATPTKIPHSKNFLGMRLGIIHKSYDVRRGEGVRAEYHQGVRGGEVWSQSFVI